MTTSPVLALHEYPPDVQHAILWYIEEERCAGWLAGYDHAQREYWGTPPGGATACRTLKALALQPSHADLLDRRGEHERAERYRQMLQERGLA